MSDNTKPQRGLSPIVKGEGVRFWDRNGKEYLDFASQTLNLLLGQCHPAVTDAVIRQAQTLTFASSRFCSDAYLDALNELMQMAPKHLSHANLKMCDGSDANETAIKTARRYTGKSLVIVLKGAHTGQTSQMIHFRGAGQSHSALRGSSEDVMLLESEFVMYPSETAMASTLGQLDACCRKGNVAAVMIDPVMVNQGVVANSLMATFLRRVEEACLNNSVLLIFDEVQSFGWVPGYWACLYYGVRPNIISLAKGLSAGYPLAACLMEERLASVLNYNEGDFTAGGHPVCCAAAAACLRTLSKNDFHIADKGLFLESGLQRLSAEFPEIVRVRSVGMIAAIEFASEQMMPDRSRATIVFQQALNEGLFVRQYGATLVLKPPIVATKGDIEEACARLRSALARSRRC